MADRDQYRAFEARVLQQVQQRAEKLIGRRLPGKGVEVMPMPDGIDTVRATLRRLDVPDFRRELDTLPGTRALHIGVRRGLLGALRGVQKQRIRAQMLAPIEAILLGHDAGPADREQVLDALARYDVLARRAKPTIAVLASPTGFTDAARQLADQPGPPAVVLIGARPDGGYDIRMSRALAASPWAELFEFESADERLQRLQYHLSEQGDVLETRGLSVDELARLLGVPPAQAAALARRAVSADSRLMMVKEADELRLARSPLADEDRSMGMWSRIRRWLGFKPSVAERVRDMTAQRVTLEKQRHEIDQKIDRLEGEERQAVQSGAKAATMAEKKQLAGKLIRVRRELARHRAQAQVFTNQIEVLGTHIHHLTLKEQGKRLSLPSSEELAQEAAQAEQIMAELSANADLAHSIEVGAMTPTMQAEEADILAEFEAAAGQAVEQPAEPEAPAKTPERDPYATPPLPAEPASRQRGGMKEGPQAG